MHLSSAVEVVNESLVPFELSIRHGEHMHSSVTSDPSDNRGRASIPMKSLRPVVSSWAAGTESVLNLVLQPIGLSDLQGEVDIDIPRSQLFKGGLLKKMTKQFDVECNCFRERSGMMGDDPFVLRVVAHMDLVDSVHLSVSLFLQPRLVRLLGLTRAVP